MAAREQGQNFASRRIQNRGHRGAALLAGDFDDARPMQQSIRCHGAIGGCADEQYAATLALAYQFSQQRIIRSCQTQIDHLRMRVECGG